MARRQKKSVPSSERRPFSPVLWPAALVAAMGAAYFVYSRVDAGPRNVLLITIDTLRAISASVGISGLSV